MARNEKSSVSSLQNEEHKRILTSLLREEGNRRCADCSSRGPTWASVNLGVFVCLNCSGIHRSLGVHISKVRSTNLDTWLPEQVAFVQAMGNVRCNKFWEARLPRDFHRPPEADMGALRVYITDKYVNKRYALQGYSDSPCIENYQTHPFVLELAGKGENSSGAGGGAEAARPPPAAVAKAAPAAAVPQFDLLSLHDDPVPASVPQQQPITTAAAAPAHVQAAADWDPFAAIAREPVVATTTIAAVPVPAPLVDPFAEIERTASTWSNTTTASASSIQPPPPPPSSAASLSNNTTATSSNGGVVVVDPFALPPLPTASTTTAAAPSIAKAPVAPSQPPSMAMSSSGSLGGLAPMRSGSTNGHSKGKVSHEDILAMFDK